MARVHRILPACPRETQTFRPATGLSNPAFPLIRYDVGDVAVLDQGPCSCGRPGRLVKAIDGRTEDYIVTKRGARIGRLDHVFKDMVNVREAQIRQERPGHMTLVIVRGPNYTDTDEAQLRDETTKRVGEDVDFDITYTDAIPRTANGKLRFVVSSVK
ncbi:MAG: hypothetical protein GY851_23250 [bacterium]|nr:hypothetical protein [bacterium]